MRTTDKYQEKQFPSIVISDLETSILPNFFDFFRLLERNMPYASSWQSKPSITYEIPVKFNITMEINYGDDGC
jgi:hypothetical protein